MKTVTIKKSHEFSPNSKIYVKYGTKKLHIKGFGSYSLSVNPGEEIYTTHLWTQSNRIAYDKIVDESIFEIKPRLGKILAFIGIIIFSICFCIFLFTKSRFSFIPLVLIALYVIVYLTFLKNRYLIIKSCLDE